MPDSLPFWKTKRLDEMTPDEWESLCDGCGRCCLLKLEDEDTAEIVYTRLSCSLLDIGSCRCGDYENRHAKVPDCVQLTPETAATLAWLPSTCAYRLVSDGEDLSWWHPLVSGSAETVHEAGISVRDFAVSETKVKNGRYDRFLLKWDAPDRPARRKRQPRKITA
jgi:uncharacterized cysteine cluster protein YcgN (CxxCxxCC family)